MLGCVIWSLAALVSSKRSARAPTALEQLAEGELHTPEEFSSVETSSSSLSAPLSSSLFSLCSLSHPSLDHARSPTFSPQTRRLP